jgi:hypothetical protein
VAVTTGTKCRDEHVLPSTSGAREGHRRGGRLESGGPALEDRHGSTEASMCRCFTGTSAGEIGGNGGQGTTLAGSSGSDGASCSTAGVQRPSE